MLEKHILNNELKESLLKSMLKKHKTSTKSIELIESLHKKYVLFTIPSPKLDRFLFSLRSNSTPLECGNVSVPKKGVPNTLHTRLKSLHDLKYFRKNLKIFLFIKSLNITDQRVLFITHLFSSSSDNWRRYCFTEDLLYLSNVDRVLWGIISFNERPESNFNFIEGYEPVGSIIRTTLMHELLSGIRRLVLDEPKKGERKYSVPYLLNSITTIIKHSKCDDPQMIKLKQNIAFIYRFKIRNISELNEIKQYIDRNLFHSDTCSPGIIEDIRFSTLLIYALLHEIMEAIFTFYLGTESCPEQNNSASEQTVKLLLDLYKGKTLAH